MLCCVGLPIDLYHSETDWPVTRSRTKAIYIFLNPGTNSPTAVKYSYFVTMLLLILTQRMLLLTNLPLWCFVCSREKRLAEAELKRRQEEEARLKKMKEKVSYPDCTYTKWFVLWILHYPAGVTYPQLVFHAAPQLILLSTFHLDNLCKIL